MELIGAYPLFGNCIEDVIVALEERPPSQNSFRQLFALIPNVVDLTLLITTPDILGALDGVILRNLRYFHTNVHHTCLTSFLSINSAVSILKLEDCGFDGVCPLAIMPLKRVKSLTGLASCVKHIANVGLTRLSMELREPDKDLIFVDTQGPTLLLRSIAVKFRSLYLLSVDFFADELDILAVVSAVCPTLKKLKLIEKPVGTVSVVMCFTLREFWCFLSVSDPSSNMSSAVERRRSMVSSPYATTPP